MGCSVGLIARLHDILATGDYTNGKHTLAFEKSYKETFNLKGECVAVNSCTSGLILALSALGIYRPLIPDFTFSATALAASWASHGFQVGDCDLKTFNLQPRLPSDCDGVVSTHVFGNASFCEELQNLTSRNDIPLIFDAAHAHGATYKGIPIGDMGDASVFSLSPTKSVCACEGGLVVTKRKCLADKLRLLRNYSTEPDYQMSTIGLNARLSEVHSIIGLESLCTFSERQKHRNLLVETYKSYLPEATFQETTPNSTHAWKDFSILLGEKKEKVKKELTERQIPFKEYFRPISNLNVYYGTLTPQKNAWNLYQSILQVPLHDNMTEEDCRRIAKVVSSIIDRTKPVEVPESPHVLVSSEKVGVVKNH